MSETTDITAEHDDDEQVVDQHGDPHHEAQPGDAEQPDAEQPDGDEAEASGQEPQDETAVEPAAADGADTATSDTGEAADGGQQDAGAARPPRRASRSRRATRPTSAPEHDAPDSPVPDSAAQDRPAPDSPAPDSPAGARLDVLAELGASTERAPATKPAGSGDATAALGSIVFEAPARRSGGKAAAAPTRDEVAPADVDVDLDSDADDGDGPRLPVTALLFQAPDLTSAASRSRRAQAPAGPPTFGFEQGEPEEEPSRGQQRRRRPAGPERSVNEDDSESVDEDTGEESSEDESSDESAATSSAGQRRRRRRGGRGRRSRPGGQGEGSAADDEDDEDDDESTTDAQDAGEDGGDQDESPDRDADLGQGKQGPSRAQRRRRGRGQRDQGAGSPGEDNAGDENAEAEAGHTGEGNDADSSDESGSSSSRRRRRRRRGSRSEGAESSGPDSRNDEVTALKGSTRLEAKRQRRREGRDAGRRRTVVTEAEFLARRESVDRSMVVRESDGRTQIAVLEDNVLVEHFVARRTQTSMVGNVYLGRVQNVLPSMEAAFVDLGKGRNAVLYAGEVNWDAAGMEGQPRRIEQALSSGDAVMVQVTKDPIGHKGARLTSQITLAGRYLVLVPSGGMTGISRKLPDTERARLKKLLREIVPDGAGVIVRTAAEGASEEELRLDVARLQVQWAEIERKAKSAPAPSLLHGEPDLAIRVVRDVFNEDFASVTISGDEAWDAIAGYIESIAPDLAPRLHRWTSQEDVFHAHRIDEQLTKALDRKVWLPSGGSLVIDRTEAMTVVDVNTGKFVGAGGTLEETVTRNNLEAAEEIVRQLRLRDIGGIIVIDFIDMVLESNRDLVLRRLVECLGRDRTRHQVAEVTSLGLVQMTRKRVGMGLLEAFTEPCEACSGRGHHVRSEPVEKANRPADPAPDSGRSGSRRRGRRGSDSEAAQPANGGVGGTRAASAAPAADEAAREAVKAKLATIAAAAAHAHDEHEHGVQPDPELAAMAAGADSGDEPEIEIDFDRIRSMGSDSPTDLATEAPAAGDQAGGDPGHEEHANDEQAEPEQAEPEPHEGHEQAHDQHDRHGDAPQEHEHAVGHQHG